VLLYCYKCAKFIELTSLVSSQCELTMFEQIVNKGPRIIIALFNVRSIRDTNTHARLMNFLHKLQQCIHKLLTAHTD